MKEVAKYTSKMGKRKTVKPKTKCEKKGQERWKIM